MPFPEWLFTYSEWIALVKIIHLVSLALTYSNVVGVRVNKMNIVDSQYAPGPDIHKAAIFSRLQVL